MLVAMDNVPVMFYNHPNVRYREITLTTLSDIININITYDQCIFNEMYFIIIIISSKIFVRDVLMFKFIMNG